MSATSYTNYSNTKRKANDGTDVRSGGTCHDTSVQIKAIIREEKHVMTLKIHPTTMRVDIDCDCGDYCTANEGKEITKIIPALIYYNQETYDYKTTTDTEFWVEYSDVLGMGIIVPISHDEMDDFAKQMNVMRAKASDQSFLTSNAAQEAWKQVCDAFINRYGEDKVVPEIRQIHDMVCNGNHYPLIKWGQFLPIAGEAAITNITPVTCNVKLNDADGMKEFKGAFATLEVYVGSAVHPWLMGPTNI